MKKKILIIVILVTLFVSLGSIITVNLLGNTVTFMVDGTRYKTKWIKNDDKVILPDTPSKKGYEFEGWYLDNKKIDFSTYTLEENIKVEAKFKIISYEINLDVNGGTLDSNKVTYNIESDTFTLPIPTHTEKIFVGWKTSNDKIPQINVKINKGSVGDKSYIAIWRDKNTYVYSLYLDNTLYDYAYVKENDNLLNNLPNLDTTTAGWFTNSNLTSIVKDTDVASCDKTLYTMSAISGDKYEYYELSNNNFYIILDQNINITNLVLPNSLSPDTYIEAIDLSLDNTSSVENIIIPSKIKNIKSLSIDTDIKSINLHNGLITLGDSIFRGMVIESIIIPSSITTMGDYIFKDINTNNITFETNSNLTHIGISAFENANINEIILPTNLVSIGDSAFKSTNIKSIVIPSKVKTIGNYAFDIDTLESVTFENNSILESIGDFAFYGSKISTISLPNTLKYIGKYSFSSTNLTSIRIPSSTETIAYGAFSDSKIETVIFDSASSLKIIGDRAFDKSKLKSIVIPSSVESIGAGAFAYTNLSDITFEENSNLKTIGNQAFYDITLSKTIHFYIPDSVEEIGDEAFAGIGRDSEGIYVYLNETSKLKTIGESAFNGISNTTFLLPASVETMGAKVFGGSFSGGSNLVNVNTLNIMTGSKLNKINGVNVRVENGKIVIPSSLTQIPDSTFNSLRVDFIFENINNITYIGDSAFYDTSLTDFTITNSLTHLGEYIVMSNADLIIRIEENIQVDINAIAHTSKKGTIYIDNQAAYNDFDSLTFYGVDKIYVLKTITGENEYLSTQREKLPDDTDELYYVYTW